MSTPHVFTPIPVPDLSDAACKGVGNPEVFFTNPDEDHGETSAALALCVECPVRGQCLAWAVKWKVSDGIWGGLSPKERKQLVRKTYTRKSVA